MENKEEINWKTLNRKLQKNQNLSSQSFSKTKFEALADQRFKRNKICQVKALAKQSLKL
jgi:hypothetical protein